MCLCIARSPLPVPPVPSSSRLAPLLWQRTAAEEGSCCLSMDSNKRKNPRPPNLFIFNIKLFILKTALPFSSFPKKAHFQRLHD
jgi:hypothetical protein